MAIRVKHGAELEGKGLAYGAAAQAAYARQQRKKEKDAEDKAKKLGNIGSVLSTAGAITSFIPGLQPVGVGLSIAGGALGQAAGGRGGTAGKVIASTAQGISQIYQAQEAKVQARADSFEDWQKRKDYADDTSYLRKREELDEELAIRNKTFTVAKRQEIRKFQTRQDAVWEAAGMSAMSDYDRIAIEENPQHPKYSTFMAATNKVQELANTRDRNLQTYQDAFDRDPATTALETSDRIEKKRVQDKEESDQKLKDIKTQETADIKASDERATGILKLTGGITDIEARLSKNDQLDENDEDYLDALALTALRNNLRALHASRDTILEQDKAQHKVLMQNDNKANDNARDEWIRHWAIREAGPDADDDAMLLYYELQAKELFQSIKDGGSREQVRDLMEQMSHISVLNKHGIPIQESFYMFAQGRGEKVGRGIAGTISKQKDKHDPFKPATDYRSTGITLPKFTDPTDEELEKFLSGTAPDGKL